MLRFIVSACFCAALCACAAVPPPVVPKVALPAAPAPGEPAGVVGLDADAVRVAFGSPAFVRKDGSTEMWRYDNPSCKAFFFLYAGGASLSVRHVETVPRGQDIAADPACLALMRTHTPSPVS
jgi:hypothetical protein